MRYRINATLVVEAEPYTPGAESGFALVAKNSLRSHVTGEKLPVAVGDDGYELTTENVTPQKLAELRVWTPESVLLPFGYTPEI